MPAGRPTDYKPEYVERVFKLALLGATDEEIADILGIVVQTLYNWDEQHPEFMEARARGKDDADANVADRLYKRALGYSHEAVKILQYEGQPVIVPYTEHYPPDTQAASWWLKNRQGKRWKDKQEIEHSGEIGLAERLAKARERADEPPDEASR